LLAGLADAEPLERPIQSRFNGVPRTGA